jgi:hypothetical protein
VMVSPPRRFTMAIARAQLVDVSLTREGMIPGFSLGSYLKLVDYTGRIFREGKASISVELAGVFVRLGRNAQSWELQIEKLRGDRLLGRFFAASRTK